MFSIGDMIAHPMHGAGVIDSIEERKINGKIHTYYVMRMPVGKMLIMIPTDSCEAIGVRPIVTPEQADEVIQSIAGIEVEDTQNWNHRYRENMLRIKSGDLMEVACVVKSLVARDAEKGLSTGERKMLRSAKQILISEIVLSQSVSYETVEERLNKALA